MERMKSKVHQTAAESAATSEVMVTETLEDKFKALESKDKVELELAEGKNREVRRLFESQRLTVKKLVRTQIGKIRLGELKPGKWRTLTEPEIKSLLA